LPAARAANDARAQVRISIVAARAAAPRASTKSAGTRCAASVDDSSISFYDEALTDTENRVAVAVSRGLSNKEIATELEISVRTVENHISHILDKKGFNNRVEIARYVLSKSEDR